MNSSNGQISGTPTSSITNSQITIKAQNGVGDISVNLFITVQLKPRIISYQESHIHIPIAIPYINSPTWEGDNVLFSITPPLPQGLIIDAQGVIIGTPTVSTTMQVYTVTAMNEVGLYNSTISLRVMIPPSSPHYSQSSYTLIKKERFSATPEVIGDDVVFSCDETLLPLGLLLNTTTGEIYGTPMVSMKPTAVRINATNEVGVTSTELLFEVKALSTGALITIIVVSVVILLGIVACIFIFTSKQRKKQLPIRAKPTVQKPVAHESSHNTNESTPAVEIAVDPQFAPAVIPSLSSQPPAVDSTPNESQPTNTTPSDSSAQPTIITPPSQPQPPTVEIPSIPSTSTH